MIINWLIVQPTIKQILENLKKNLRYFLLDLSNIFKNLAESLNLH